MARDKGDDIKQRALSGEDKAWRSAGGYGSSKYAAGDSGEYPASGDVKGSSKEWSPYDPNCGTASGTFKEWSPKDPNCGPDGGTAMKDSPKDPNRS